MRYREQLMALEPHLEEGMELSVVVAPVVAVQEEVVVAAAAAVAAEDLLLRLGASIVARHRLAAHVQEVEWTAERGEPTSSVQ